jgi:hypothetical protein
VQSYERSTPQQDLLVPFGHVHRTWQKRNASLQVARQRQLPGRRGRPQFIAQRLYTEGHDKQDPARTQLPKLISMAMATMPVAKVRSQIERITSLSLGELRNSSLRLSRNQSLMQHQRCPIAHWCPAMSHRVTIPTIMSVEQTPDGYKVLANSRQLGRRWPQGHRGEYVKRHLGKWRLAPASPPRFPRFPETFGFAVSGRKAASRPMAGRKAQM